MNIGQAIHEEREKNCDEYRKFTELRGNVCVGSYLNYGSDKKKVNKLQGKHIKGCKICADAKQTVLAQLDDK